MENLVEHFRDRKFPDTFEPSSARDEIERFQELYSSGRLFGDDLLVSEEPEVQEAVTSLARRLSEDLRSHLDLSEAGGDADGDPEFKVTYNGWVPIQTPLGGGYCALGGYNFSTGVCAYWGVGRCTWAK
jgi:hypothetical protein